MCPGRNQTSKLLVCGMTLQPTELPGRGLTVPAGSASPCWMVFSNLECRGRDPCDPIQHVSQVSQMLPGSAHLTLPLSPEEAFCAVHPSSSLEVTAFSVQLTPQNKPGPQQPLAPQGGRAKWSAGTEKALSGVHSVAEASWAHWPCRGCLAVRPQLLPSPGRWVVSKSTKCHP